MPASKRWKVLKREVETLRMQFLPEPFRSLGDYPKPRLVQAQARAFLVLSHAEIESYLEEWAKDIAKAAEVIWTSKAKITPPVAFLLATRSERLLPPQSFVGGGVPDTPFRFNETLMRAFQQYYKLIKDNHGIKEQNVLTLFGPLGIPSSAFSATLAPNLDSLGERRGEHAHHSAKAVSSTLSPEDLYKSVMLLVDDLLTLDAWLLQTKKGIR